MKEHSNFIFVAFFVFNAISFSHSVPSTKLEYKQTSPYKENVQGLNSSPLRRAKTFVPIALQRPAKAYAYYTPIQMNNYTDRPLLSKITNYQLEDNKVELNFDEHLETFAMTACLFNHIRPKQRVAKYKSRQKSASFYHTSKHTKKASCDFGDALFKKADLLDDLFVGEIGRTTEETVDDLRRIKNNLACKTNKFYIGVKPEEEFRKDSISKFQNEEMMKLMQATTLTEEQLALLFNLVKVPIRYFNLRKYYIDKIYHEEIFQDQLTSLNPIPRLSLLQKEFKRLFGEKITKIDEYIIKALEKIPSLTISTEKVEQTFKSFKKLNKEEYFKSMDFEFSNGLEDLKSITRQWIIDVNSLFVKVMGLFRNENIIKITKEVRGNIKDKIERLRRKAYVKNMGGINYFEFYFMHSHINQLTTNIELGIDTLEQQDAYYREIGNTKKQFERLNKAFYKNYELIVEHNFSLGDLISVLKAIDSLLNSLEQKDNTSVYL